MTKAFAGSAAGNITLSFSYPVDLSKLQSSLKVVTPGASSASKYTVSISPCVTTYYRIFWLASTTRTTDANSLKQNATCAVVRISPALAPQQEAALQLPVGARYNALAGTVKSAQEVKVRQVRHLLLFSSLLKTMLLYDSACYLVREPAHDVCSTQ